MVRRVASIRPSTKLTVDDQDLPGGLLLGQGIEDRVDGLTEDGTIGNDFLRGTNVLVLGDAWFDVVQDVTGKARWLAAPFEVLQSRLDGDDIVGVTGALDIGESLRKNFSVKTTYPYVPEILTGPIMRLATMAAGPSWLMTSERPAQRASMSSPWTVTTLRP